MGNLLYLVAVILIIFWAVGFVGYSYTGGGLIHILLIIAVIAIVLKVIQGRRVL
jgi:tryptophan-rich sensory protein